MLESKNMHLESEQIILRKTMHKFWIMSLKQHNQMEML